MPGAMQQWSRTRVFFVRAFPRASGPAADISTSGSVGLSSPPGGGAQPAAAAAAPLLLLLVWDIAELGFDVHLRGCKHLGCCT